MRVTRGPATWAKRTVLAVVLVGAAVIPGRASSEQPRHCTGVRCTAAGSTLWTAALPGLWVAQPGVSGTVPATVGAYAATGGGVAVIGSGRAVTAFNENTGKRLWRVALTGVPAGSAIVGVRAFPEIIAVGVAPQQPASAPGQSRRGRSSRGHPVRGHSVRGQSRRGRPSRGQSLRGQSVQGRSGPGRYEVMLWAATGRQIRIYPSATYGGAVAANDASTVIVGSHAITAYDNTTGRVRWSRAIGPTGQTWRVTGDTIYVTGGSASHGGDGPDALRRIDLLTGAQGIVHLAAKVGPGSLIDAVGNVVLFSGADGVQAYDGTTGKLLWSRTLSEVELADSGQDSVYLVSGNRLLGVDISTGSGISSAPISVAASLYWVTSGVALGLDENALGEAWGYNLRTRRIVWTSGSLPWPHFFVDLSGLGGSLSPGSAIALLATCENVGAAANAHVAPVCRRPVLEAIRI